MATWWDEYREYLKSDHWRAVRAEALKRAGYRCEFRYLMLFRCPECERLEVHHKPGAYKRLGEERAGDLMVLCHDHHEQVTAASRKKRGR